MACLFLWMQPQLKFFLLSHSHSIYVYCWTANYFVLKMDVKKVDLSAQKTVSARAQRFFDRIGLENVLLPRIVSKVLPPLMSDMLKDKMNEKMLKADSRVVSERKQEKYFKRKIKEIRAAAKLAELSGGGDEGGEEPQQETDEVGLITNDAQRSKQEEEEEVLESKEEL